MPASDLPLRAVDQNDPGPCGPASTTAALGTTGTLLLDQTPSMNLKWVVGR